jgi:hypothetical protein
LLVATTGVHDDHLVTYTHDVCVVFSMGGSSAHAFTLTSCPSALK